MVIRAVIKDLLAVLGRLLAPLLTLLAVLRRILANSLELLAPRGREK